MRLRVWLLVTALMLPVTSYAQQPSWWVARNPDHLLVGKTREEVVQLLGEPTKTKVRRGATLLVYKSNKEEFAVFPHTTAIPDAFQEEPDAIQTLIDLFLDRDSVKVPAGSGYKVTAGKKSPIRRIEVRLDSKDCVEAVRVVWRKGAQGPTDSTVK